MLRSILFGRYFFHLVCFLAGCLGLIAILSRYISPVFAEQAHTDIHETILSGNLGITLPSFLEFSPIISNSSIPQVSNATLTGLSMTDERGIGTGWSITASCTNFFAINQPVTLHGENNTLSDEGYYNSDQQGDYIITITTPGQPGEALYSLQGMETGANLPTGTNVAVGTRGITATFAKTFYHIGDSWEISIDTIPVTNLTLTPERLRGTNSPVILGTKHGFSNVNDLATIMSTTTSQSGGNFFTDLVFSLIIPPFTYANTYTAVLTITTD